MQRKGMIYEFIYICYLLLSESVELDQLYSVSHQAYLS